MKPGNNKDSLIMEHLPDAFAYHQVITDDEGKPEEYIVLEVNRAFEKMFNLPKSAVMGKRITEVFPNIKASSFDWIDTFGKVALTGENMRLEHYYKPRDCWLDIASFSDEPGYFGVIFRDISEHKKAVQKLQQAYFYMTMIIDSIDAHVYIIDMESYEILFVNEYGRRVWGDISGQLCWKTLQQGQDGPCPCCTNDKLVDKDGNPTSVIAWETQNNLNGRWYDCRDRAVQWHDGRCVRMEIAIDITKRKEAEQKLGDYATELEELYRHMETLLLETHHRVKNNLAVITSLLNMQRRYMGEGETAHALHELSNRIYAMALVHEKLYRSKKFSCIDMQQYLQTLINHLRHSLQVQRNIEYQLEAEGVEMNLEVAVPCALIIQELLTNAIKHAFPTDSPSQGTAPATIKVKLTQSKKAFQLEVSDNGIGLPPGLELAKVHTIGLRLVRMIGEHQLGGRVETQVGRKGGTKFKLHFYAQQS